MDLNQTISISSEVLAQEVSGEMVLLDLASEQYLGLNEVGARVWQLLEKNTDLQTVYDTLLSEYDVEEEILKNDLDQLIADMLKTGVINVEEKEA